MLKTLVAAFFFRRILAPLTLLTIHRTVLVECMIPCAFHAVGTLMPEAAENLNLV